MSTLQEELEKRETTHKEIIGDFHDTRCKLTKALYHGRKEKITPYKERPGQIEEFTKEEIEKKLDKNSIQFHALWAIKTLKVATIEEITYYLMRKLTNRKTLAGSISSYLSEVVSAGYLKKEITAGKTYYVYKSDLSPEMIYLGTQRFTAKKRKEQNKKLLMVKTGLANISDSDDLLNRLADKIIERIIKKVRNGDLNKIIEEIRKG